MLDNIVLWRVSPISALCQVWAFISLFEPMMVSSSSRFSMADTRLYTRISESSSYAYIFLWPCSSMAILSEERSLCCEALRVTDCLLQRGTHVGSKQLPLQLRQESSKYSLATTCFARSAMRFSSRGRMRMQTGTNSWRCPALIVTRRKPSLKHTTLLCTFIPNSAHYI